MWFNFYALTLIGSVICATSYRKAHVLSPLMLVCFAWMGVFFVGLWVAEDYYPVTTEVKVAWVIWFVVQAVFFFAVSGRHTVRHDRPERPISQACCHLIFSEDNHAKIFSRA